MIIGNGSIGFISRGKTYMIEPGDIFQDNGFSLLYLPHHRLYRGWGNPGAQEIPKKEWKILKLFLTPISYEDLQDENPLLENFKPGNDVYYFEFLGN